MLVLAEKKVTTVNLSLHREGIKDYLTVYGDKQKLYDLTGIDIDGEEQKKARKEKSSKEKLLELLEAKPHQKRKEKTEESKDEKLESDREVTENKEAEPSKEIKEDEQTRENQQKYSKIIDKTEADEDDDKTLKEEKKKEVTKVDISDKEIPSQKEEKKSDQEEQKENPAKNKTDEPISDFVSPKDIPTNFEELILEQPMLVKESLEEKRLNPALIEGYKQMISNLEEDQEVYEEDMQTHLDDLQIALKNSMDQAQETPKKFVDPEPKKEIMKEKVLAETEILQSKKDKKRRETMRHQEKLKKMFIKKTIQNLDEHFDEKESFKTFDNFEDKEVKKIKSIIAKKKQMSIKQFYANESREYTKNYIGMNTPPMYKNIYESAKKVLKEMENNLKEEYSEEANILERLSKLSEEFNKESKNARVFDEAKTTDLFRDLADFFDQNNNYTKITQYELYTSNIIHSLQSFLSLPIKEEESKSSGKNKEKAVEKDSDEYMTILSRYLCFVNIFLREKDTKAFRNLLLTLENAMKISFSNYYSSELSAYNGGVNLAYDLQKYFK